MDQNRYVGNMLRVNSERDILYLFSVLHIQLHICENTVMVKKFDVKIFMGLHVFGLPEYDKVDLGTLSVSLYLCMCTLMDGWFSFIFSIQSS
jgi:hypothetical protein